VFNQKFWLAEIACGGVSMKLESHISENVALLILRVQDKVW